FLKASDEDKPDAMFSTIFLWWGPFTKSGGGLTGHPGATWNLTLAESQTFLKLPLREGDETKFSIGNARFSMKVEGFESVTVPAGTFKNCYKLSQTSEGSPQVKTFWLASGVGIVKIHLYQEGL